ncbi:MAG: HAD-IIIA family hydrolase, partial [Syntrophales bacterium]|nr:HAD-IIIA family hydrolase [Syntrophales bacterium]
MCIRDSVDSVHAHLAELFRSHGARIDAFYYCPHHPEGREPYGIRCRCRKPEAGLLMRAAEEMNIDLSRSWMIGDMPKDILAGQRVGAKGILVKTGHPAGTDAVTATPDYVARDVLEAVMWIIGEWKREGRKG